jgi:hypothetical protein
MKTNVEIKINQCMSCPFAHQVISDYSLFYSDYVEYDKNKKPYDEDFKSEVRNISEMFNFKGNFDEQLSFILNFSKKKTNRDIHKKLDIEFVDCVENLHRIIKSVAVLFNDSSDGEFYIEDWQKYTVEVIGKIKSLLEDDESYCSDKCINAAWSRIKKLKDHYDNGDNCSLDQLNSIYNKYKNILTDYCNTPINSLKYEYSSSNDSRFRNCQCENFLNCVEKYDGSAVWDFSYQRIDKLKAEYRDIVYDFISRIPKSFCDIFTAIVNIQNLSDTNIKQLLYVGKDKFQSSISSLRKSETPKLTRTEIKKLSRILLVSEDVLKCGTGKSYGVWKTTDTVDEISEIINLSDSDFKKKLIEKNIYNEQDICVFYKVDDKTKEVYADYEKMFDTAKHQEEIDTLISVLEDMQAKENT